jgi:hypothetical protein
MEAGAMTDSIPDRGLTLAALVLAVAAWLAERG